MAAQWQLNGGSMAARWRLDGGSMAAPSSYNLKTQFK
jgi:hypothetical protein